MGKVNKKITVEIPYDLLESAQNQTKKGITETIRQGLRHIAASRSYENLLKSKGKIKKKINWKRLKEDRE